MDAPPASHVFGFAFDGPGWMARLTRLAGVTPARSWVILDEHRFEVRFGRWRLSTPRANVAEARVTGPYRRWKVAGPPRVSLADRGVTFATTDREGVCVRFREPVAGVLGSRWPHPAATVTVADCGGLVGTLIE
jgi:hypothetical protein